mmetsp:Transcript_13564/g.33345  ORF Transcript_13564/g.33345 Transcript_13564/m.33345 type:complete len:209 (+) Transcript_13564:1081-1707(+)
MNWKSRPQHPCSCGPSSSSTTTISSAVATTTASPSADCRSARSPLDSISSSFFRSSAASWSSSMSMSSSTPALSPSPPASARRFRSPSCSALALSLAAAACFFASSRAFFLASASSCFFFTSSSFCSWSKFISPSLPTIMLYVLAKNFSAMRSWTARVPEPSNRSVIKPPLYLADMSPKGPTAMLPACSGNESTSTSSSLVCPISLSP